MKNILIIEDDKTKIERLRSFLLGQNIVIKESFQSGVFELKKNFRSYDVLILDMTIPLWEKGNNDLGGNFEQFGGENVLREMKRRKLIVPTILFTMFDNFPTSKGNITYEELNSAYRLDFPGFYKGVVFYSSNEENWKSNLQYLLDKIDCSHE